MIKQPQQKYIPFVPLKMERRAWPDRQLTHPPIWCSVDLRDGNQALVDPNTESQPKSEPADIYGTFTMIQTADNVAKQFGVKQAPTLVVTTDGGFEKYAGAGAIKQYAAGCAR